MNDPQSNDLPESSEELMRVVRSGPSAEVREAAFRKLAPRIEALAFSIAAPVMGADRQKLDEFCTEAPGQIWERLDHFDTTCPFEPWCSVVLRNLLYDRLREQRRRREQSLDAMECGNDDYHVGFPEDPSWRRERAAAELAMYTAEPFSAGDLEYLERELTTPVRVTSLVIEGLWDKVPPERWQAWLAAAHMPPDFPPSEVLLEDDPVHRMRLLPSLLGTTAENIRARRSRGKRALREFPYLKKLREQGEGL